MAQEKRCPPPLSLPSPSLLHWLFSDFREHRSHFGLGSSLEVVSAWFRAFRPASIVSVCAQGVQWSGTSGGQVSIGHLDLQVIVGSPDGHPGLRGRGDGKTGKTGTHARANLDFQMPSRAPPAMLAQSCSLMLAAVDFLQSDDRSLQPFRRPANMGCFLRMSVFNSYYITSQAST